MVEGILYFFTKPDPNRPIEEQYVAELDNHRKSFKDQEDAMLYLFDNGIKYFKRLTKEVNEYKNIKNIPTYEFLQVENRVGYILYGEERYIDENDNVKSRKAFVWRFIGFGRPCFAKSKELLKEKVLQIISDHNDAPKELGYTTYPYYTKYFRKQID